MSLLDKLIKIIEPEFTRTSSALAPEFTRTSSALARLKSFYLK